MTFNLVRVVPEMVGSAYDTDLLLIPGVVGVIAAVVYPLAKARATAKGSLATELMLAGAWQFYKAPGPFTVARDRTITFW